MIKRYLSTKRLLLLVRKDLFIEKKFLAITPVTIGLLIIIASFMGALNRNNPDFHLSFYTFLLYTIGIIITSKIFTEMHSLKKNHFWYMTPASDLEKFLSRFIISAVIWPVFLLILYSAVSILSEVINNFTLGYRNNPLSPFNIVIWKRIGHYILIQSMFLYGAALFKKHQLIKMGLSLMVFAGFLFIVAVILMKQVMGTGHWTGGFHNFYQFYGWNNGYKSFNMNFSSIKIEKFFEILRTFLKIFYFFIMAPLFWVLTYLKVRHNEASNGIQG